ncbi:hypothetical protein GCM10010946_29910 [Undibacterium squillarum]|uniref:Flagellar brake protein YcgR n=1 Tax=Undibacterium squillarum TaxID=1131567 RepID=A0ABQ2Y229_9BURK|nr:hypothetical protein GCM10010946_29910 [Undibacterium squillarum]
MPLSPTFGTENLSPFQVESRREIISLLKGLQNSNQLISMLINGGSEVFITSILEVDEQNDTVIIDSAPDNMANERIAQSDRVSFEGLLDKIGIQFAAGKITRVSFENRPALQFSIPGSLIRLQRREYYRINTPLSTPIKVSIPADIDGRIVVLHLTLVDISCGGIAILDEKKVLDCTVGKTYEHCHLDLPSTGPITVTLQIRNSQELVLLNGKTNRRIGCQFINLSNSVLSGVQRYIMKLERERNSRLNGIR